jgi:hypothetical protein
MAKPELITALAAALMVLAAGALVLRIYRPKQQPAPEQPRTENYAPDMIQKFINERWTIQAEIRDANDLATMEDLYWDIERFELDYKDLVPDQLLLTHVNELFNAHARTTSRVRSLSRDTA